MGISASLGTGGVGESSFHWHRQRARRHLRHPAAAKMMTAENLEGVFRYYHAARSLRAAKVAIKSMGSRCRDARAWAAWGVNMNNSAKSAAMHHHIGDSHSTKSLGERRMKEEEMGPPPHPLSPLTGRKREEGSALSASLARLLSSHDCQRMGSSGLYLSGGAPSPFSACHAATRGLTTSWEEQAGSNLSLNDKLYHRRAFCISGHCF